MHRKSKYKIRHCARTLSKYNIQNVESVPDKKDAHEYAIHISRRYKRWRVQVMDLPLYILLHTSGYDTTGPYNI